MSFDKKFSSKLILEHFPTHLQWKILQLFCVLVFLAVKFNKKKIISSKLSVVTIHEIVLSVCEHFFSRICQFRVQVFSETLTVPLDT